MMIANSRVRIAIRRISRQDTRWRSPPHQARQSAAWHLLRHLHGGVRRRIVLMALMFEQLGATDTMVRLDHVRRSDRALCGHRSRCRPRARSRDYFACGRARSGFLQRAGARASPALGGAGFLALTGSLFIDRLRRPVLEHRLVRRSRVRARCCSFRSCARSAPTRCRPFSAAASTAAPCASWRRRMLPVPILLLLAAEARFAAYAAAWLLGQSERLTAVLVVVLRRRRS